MSFVCSESKQLAIITFDQNNLIPQNITNDEETGEISSSTSSFVFFRFPNLIGEFHRHYTAEHFITMTFVWIMATSGICHLSLGLELLEKTGLSNSISLKLMYVLKYFLVAFASYSHVRADVFCRMVKKTPVLRKRRYFGMWLALPLSHFFIPYIGQYLRIVYYISGVLYVACMGGSSEHEKFVNIGLYCVLQTIILPIGIRVSLTSDSLLVVAVLTSFRAAHSDLELLTSASPLVCFLDKRVQKLMPVASTCLRSALKKRKKTGKLVKYSIGLSGTLLFQCFLRVTTFGEVKAFMYLATSWLANLTLINATDDFGVFNFMLGNMILGSTVSQSGLGITTWFTYGVCLFLYILRIMLESINISQDVEKSVKPPIMFWIFCSCTVFDWLWDLVH